jgi:hypothetical protein
MPQQAWTNKRERQYAYISAPRRRIEGPSLMTEAQLERVFGDH